MRKSRGPFILVGVVAMIGMLVGWVSVSSTSAKSLPNGSTLKQGAFALTPVSAEERAAIGEQSARSGYSFYLVKMALENRSATDPFDFEAHEVLARSLDGGKLVRSRAGQEALGTDGDPLELKPGEKGERTLVFEGPVGVRRVGVLFNLRGGPAVLVLGLFGESKQVVVPVAAPGRR